MSKRCLPRQAHNLKVTGSNPAPQPRFDSNISEMARFGGLFHLFRTIPKAFKKKRCFDNALHEFRRRLPSLVKNSTAQNWHKMAQKF
jgi:hypothetical protein